MKKLLLILLMLGSCCALQAQLFTGVMPTADPAYCLQTDALGNIYKGGFADNYLDGWSLEKYAPNGSLLWQVHDGGTSAGGVVIYKVAVAANGDVYVTTSLRPGSHIGQDSIVVSGIADYAFIKYNSQGQLQWYKLLTGSPNGTEQFGAISIMSNGNIVVQGHYDGNCVFAGQAFNSPGNHIFWGIFDPNGNNLSMHEYTGSTAIAWDSELDAAGNLVVAGYDYGLFQMSLFNFDLNSAALNWAFRVPTGHPQMNALTQDASGNIYLTGSFSDTVVVGGNTYPPNAGSADTYVLMVTSAGTLGWFNQLGGPNIDNGLDIAVHPNGDIYITGYFTTDSDFDGTSIASYGANDVFFACLDGAGQLKWATQGGTTANDQGSAICYNAFTGGVMATGILGNGSNAIFGATTFPGYYGGYLLGLADGACQVKGHVYRDNNNNGTQDPGEPDFPNRIARIQPGPYFANSASSGDYNTYTSTGNFTIDMPVLPAYYVLSTPATQSASFSAFGQVDAGNDFGLYATANINDLRINITPYTQTIRANSSTGFTLTYENVGTTFMNGAVVTFTYDSLVYAGSYPVAASTSPGVVTWNLPQLYPGQSGALQVYFNVPNLMLGNYLPFTATIDPVAGDTTPLNNVDSLALLVTNSFDPNDKAVLPAGPITPAQAAAGIPLDFTVRFQNTGNDTAYFVRLRDTLSPLLDLATFQWIAESHPAVWTIDANRILTVDFYNINLLDSTSNEAESHGFFRYAVQPLTTAQDGDVIRNTAYIYFDFNPPIVTNTTVTLIQEPVAVDPGTTTDWLQVYPNPAQDQLHFAWKGVVPAGAMVELWDGMGRRVLACPLTREGAHLSVGQLPAGMYAFRVLGRGAVLAHGKAVVTH